MKKYDRYLIEDDWIRNTSWLFYLCGYVEKENCGYVIASYSFKTDKLIIKNAGEHIPPQNVLQDFINHAKKMRFQNAENFINIKGSDE